MMQWKYSIFQKMTQILKMSERTSMTITAAVGPVHKGRMQTEHVSKNWYQELQKAQFYFYSQHLSCASELCSTVPESAKARFP